MISWYPVGLLILGQAFWVPVVHLEPNLLAPVWSQLEYRLKKIQIFYLLPYFYHILIDIFNPFTTYPRAARGSNFPQITLPPRSPGVNTIVRSTSSTSGTSKNAKKMQNASMAGHYLSVAKGLRSGFKKHFSLF